MNRLTAKKEDRYFENEAFWVDAEQPSIDKIDDVYFKLAEFEDFMEDNGFRSFDDLYYAFGYIRFVDGYDEVKDEEIHKQEFIRYADAYKDRVKAYKELYNKNQELKDRWQKLKEFVTENFNYFKNGYGIFDDIFADNYRKVLDKMQELEDEGEEV